VITSAVYLGEFQQLGSQHFKAKVQLVDDHTGSRQVWMECRGASILALTNDITRQIVSMNTVEQDAVQLAEQLQGSPSNAIIPVTFEEAEAEQPTGLEVWREKAARLAKVKALGLTDSTAVSEIAALESDVNSTYAAGFAAQF
jgi:hypothetical protein